MVKIIFFDIDGTLIDIDADDMSDKTKYALQKLKENKILILRLLEGLIISYLNLMVSNLMAF